MYANYSPKTHQKNNIYFRDVNILVVGGNPVNQRVVTEMLKSMGCSITVVENGLEAFEITDKQEFDFTFMDCQMPKMGGFEAAQSIRNREKSENVSRSIIVVLTVNAMRGDRDRCMLLEWMIILPSQLIIWQLKNSD